MSVYKVFFRILNRLKMRVIMYLGIFLAMAFIISSQGEEAQSGIVLHDGVDV